MQTSSFYTAQAFAPGFTHKQSVKSHPYKAICTDRSSWIQWLLQTQRHHSHVAVSSPAFNSHTGWLVFKQVLNVVGDQHIVNWPSGCLNHAKPRSNILKSKSARQFVSTHELTNSLFPFYKTFKKIHRNKKFMLMPKKYSHLLHWKPQKHLYRGQVKSNSFMAWYSWVDSTSEVFAWSSVCLKLCL